MTSLAAALPRHCGGVLRGQEGAGGAGGEGEGRTEGEEGRGGGGRGGRGAGGGFESSKPNSIPSAATPRQRRFARVRRSMRSSTAGRPESHEGRGAWMRISIGV